MSDVITRMKSGKFAPGLDFLKNETHEMATFTAHVPISASTSFEWQKYNCYEEFSCIVAYMLSFLPEVGVKQTNSWSMTDPDEFLEAERRLILPVRTKLIPAKTKTCKSCSPTAGSQFWKRFPPNWA